MCVKCCGFCSALKAVVQRFWVQVTGIIALSIGLSINIDLSFILLNKLVYMLCKYLMLYWLSVAKVALGEKSNST